MQNSNNPNRKQVLRSSRIIQPLFALILLMLSMASTMQALNLFWDAGNTNDGGTIDPGSGGWDTDTTTNLNWNNGTGNVSWTQTGVSTPLNGATFNGPDAPDFTYQVTVDGGQVAATNLTINGSGYAFSGSPIYLNLATPLFFIADGKSVTFSNNLTGNNSTSELRMGINGAPATVYLYGTLTGYQPLFSSTNGSVFYLAGPGINSSGTAHVDADVRMTNGTYNSGGAFVIGRLRPGQTQPLNGTGVFTLGGSAIFNQNNDYISLGRDSVWNSTLIVQDGATLNDQVTAAASNPGIGIPRPGSSGANNQSWMKVYGGTVNMGASGVAAQPIALMSGGSQPGQVAVLTQTNGVINAWGGIQIGGSAGTYSGGSAMVTNSGGFLYLGSLGGSAIRYGVGVPPTNVVSLSGGTVGALQSWISSVPITLDVLNGNITFQCADSFNDSYNISLSGALTGPGGFNLTGAGMLTLSGPNNYAGLTAISNGTLVVSTANSPRNGSVIIDGSGVASGLPVVSNLVASPGQSWTMTNLTFSAGTPTLSFNFDGLTPSTTVAPIQDYGNLTFAITPQFLIDGSALSVGDYPLIHYTGTISGTPPAVPMLPGGVSGTIVNNTGANTIVLHVTAGPSPVLTWGVGNGVWDINTTANWKQFGSAAKYQEGNAVQFDDTASGTSPITVTLNTTVNPSGVTAASVAKAYVINGTGGINGATAVNVTSGTLTLSDTNTYTGGTTVSGPGQLNINYGGNGGANSAIGTGPLNLNTGAKIDNTSGGAVALNTSTPIPINWNDDWTFVGSTNFDLGLGQVTLGNIQVVLTVVSNTLTVNNQIIDNGQNYQLTKQGNGTLTLSNANNFGGGMQLNAGTLNINADGAVGTGHFTINGGTIDNTSGSTIILGTVASPPSEIEWSGSITFGGTTNLDLGSALINVAATTLTLQSNTLFTEGDLDGHNGPGVTVNGPGTWNLGGSISDNTLSITINGGEVDFNKTGGYAVNGNTTTVNTGGTLVMLYPSGVQMAASATLVLGGGTVDMNGDSEGVTNVTFNSGILRNSAPGTTAGFPVGTVTLGGAVEVFDLAADSSLIVSNAIGSGELVETGTGVLNLTTNSYTGNTIISNGTLVLNFPTLATNSTLTISTNATLGTNGVLNLNFANSATNTVAALILGGAGASAGVHNASTDPAYITGAGSLLVAPPASTINPNPGKILFSVSGTTLNLAWPTNAGWLLQAETNPPHVGVNNSNWVTVQGSASVTNMSVTRSPTNGPTFFRMVYP